MTTDTQIALVRKDTQTRKYDYHADGWGHSGSVTHVRRETDEAVVHSLKVSLVGGVSRHADLDEDAVAGLFESLRSVLVDWQREQSAGSLPQGSFEDVSGVSNGAVESVTLASGSRSVELDSGTRDRIDAMESVA